ncbi:MAG: methionine synthase [Candidatus Omnitrophica bacterium]|nr:methionine synthase [Candidatus Omnitrophota bacterium]
MMTIKEKIQKDLILLDGAFGTYAQMLGLGDTHFGDKPGCMEYLSVQSPDFVTKIHEDYLEAGADAVETNTFGGNALKLAEYGLGDDVYDINLASTRLARSAADRFSSGGRPRYVLGTMGPTGKLPSSQDSELGNVLYSDLKEDFYRQALAIIDGGADALLIETGQDLLEMKAGVNGARQALKERRKDLLVLAQCTLANNGRMLLGTEISAVCSTLAYLGADVVGLNCSTGPVEMEEAVRYLSSRSSAYISCVPNAGLPLEKDGKTVYPLKPDEMAQIMARLVRDYHIDIIGGCCGTSPEHIKAMKGAVTVSKKRALPANFSFSSYYRAKDLRRIKRPVKVGERINTQGSRRMKDLLRNEDYDNIVELGKSQQKDGADILDVCTVLTERSTEKRDAVILTRSLGESVDIPLMIDSTDADVIESALENYPGTPFINSVNLEDGGRKADRVFSLAKEHGGFVVNLVIDEKGMAKTVERRLGIAERLYKKGVEEHGLQPHRMIFDMLTFTLGTGEDEYTKSGRDTLRAIKMLKEKYPDVLTVLGVSNISFGLQKNARKVLNMVFLHHAVKSGLDLAIVNPGEYLDDRDIHKDDKKLAEDLLFNRRDDALSRLVAHFDRSAAEAVEVTEGDEHLTAEEKLRKCVFERDKSGIIKAVEEAMESYTPQQIINDILMAAMREVGDKLDSGEMVLPYVLQSAEVMRKAIEYLEGYLPAESVANKGKVLLATVFGDVHDIGKNLVKMILKNNGFQVIDLGKQVPVEKIVEEARKNKVDAVGLSALLVSTARHMKTCVQAMYDAGLEYPVLIGGAPTNDRFAREISLLRDKSVYKGGVFYSRDAFTGLKIMQALMDPAKKKEAMNEYLCEEAREGKARRRVAPKRRESPTKKESAAGKVPMPPFFGVRPLSSIPADGVFEYLDKRAVFELAWGAKLKDQDKKHMLMKKEYEPLLDELKQECMRKGWLDLKAVYGYFRCRVEGDKMQVLDEGGSPLEEFIFPVSGGICLTDYFVKGPDKLDVAAFQAVTVGKRINRAISELGDNKEYARAFYLHGLSVHLAEALASYVHDLIRSEWGLNKGQGKRYSPGYPMWRDLKDQSKLFRLLEINERLGLDLTRGYQIVPEQSTTAMIVHSDKAEYQGG